MDASQLQEIVRPRFRDVVTARNTLIITKLRSSFFRSHTPYFTLFGISQEALCFHARLQLVNNTNYICEAFSTGNGGSGKLEINNSCPCVRTREAHV